MRLPGTFNIGYSNHLLPIQAIAAARRERRLSEASADIPLKKKGSEPKLSVGGKNDKATKDTKSTENDGFTAKEDKKLLKLKTEENKSWKEIATALAKDVGAVKERWQKVRPDKQDSDKPAGEAKKEEKQEANKKEKRSDSKKGLMQQGEGGDIILEPDENFNFDEVGLSQHALMVDFPDAHRSSSSWSLRLSSKTRSKNCGVVSPIASGKPPSARSILGILGRRSQARKFLSVWKLLNHIPARRS